MTPQEKKANDLAVAGQEILLAMDRFKGKQLDPYAPDDAMHRMQPMSRCVAALMPEGHGFILLVAQHGESEGRRLHYTVDGMDYEAVKGTLQELLAEIGGPEDLGKHKL